MNYSVAIEKRDIHKIDNLNRITTLSDFWDKVREFTKNVKSEHSLKRWQCLAEIRYKELEQECLASYHKRYEVLLSEVGEHNMHQIMDWFHDKAEFPKSLTDYWIVSHAHTLRMIYWQCKIRKLM